MGSRSKADRRRFLRTVGMAGISSALVVPVLSSAQSPVPTAQPGTAPAAVPADTVKAPAPPEISEEARALAGIIERRYGAALTQEQLGSIAKDFDSSLRAATRMRGVKLGNGDEPDFTFKA